MHTEKYKTILTKLKRGGKERLDGFLPSEFSGITADEKRELAAILAQDNDFQALSVLLLEDEFAELLRSSIETLECNSDSYVDALIWAGKVRAVDNVLDRLVTCMGHMSNWATGSAINFLSVTVIPTSLIGSYFEALAGVLNRKDTTPILALKASAEILRLKGIEPKSAEYIDFSNRLQAKDGRIKGSVLAELAALR